MMGCERGLKSFSPLRGTISENNTLFAVSQTMVNLIIDTMDLSYGMNMMRDLRMAKFILETNSPSRRSIL